MNDFVTIAQGARRQVQGVSLAPPWILLFRFLQNTIHAQCLTQIHSRLFSTDWNITAGVAAVHK